MSKEDLDSLSKTLNQTQKKLEDKFSSQENIQNILIYCFLKRDRERIFKWLYIIKEAKVSLIRQRFLKYHCKFVMTLLKYLYRYPLNT